MPWSRVQGGQNVTTVEATPNDDGETLIIWSANDKTAGFQV